MNTLRYQDILSSPGSSVPSLSADDIKTIIIETSLAYLAAVVSLKSLLDIMRIIDQYCKVKLSLECRNVIETISALPVRISADGSVLDMKTQDMIQSCLVDSLDSLVGTTQKIL